MNPEANIFIGVFVCGQGCAYVWCEVESGMMPYHQCMGWMIRSRMSSSPCPDYCCHCVEWMCVYLLM